jgi:MFS family permease
VADEKISNAQIAKVAVGATIGTIMEWYDFFLAALAATQVWAIVFFPKLNPVAGIAASVSTYVVTYFTRPIGAFVFGHYGDRIGRKTMLIWTLALMGGSSIGIGVTPGYSAIGLAAPIIVILLRIILGFGLGGEWGGAASWLLEFSADSRFRGFWSSWINAALPLGLALGAGLFTLFRIIMPHNFVAIGWRYPFIIGGIMVMIGVVIRYALSESPLFIMQKNKGEIDRSPATKVFKAEWKLIMLQGLSWAYIIAATSGVVIAYSVPYLIASKLNPIFVSFSVVIAGITTAVFTVIGGVISDLWSKKGIMIISIILTILFSFPYFLLLNTRSQPLIVVAQVFLLGFAFLGFGVLPRRFGEHFQTKFRYSGAGLSYQIGAVLGSIPVILPQIFAVIAGGFLKAWPYVAEMLIIVSVLSLLGTLFAKETSQLKAVDT